MRNRIHEDHDYMRQKYENLKVLLKELFQLDQPELDFDIGGIEGQIAHGDTRTLASMTSTSSVKQARERSCLV